MEDQSALTETGATGSKNENVTEDKKKVLYSHIQELKSLNAALFAESEMYEEFISRLDPDELYSTVVEESGAKGGGRGWRQKSQSEQQLTLIHKCYVAQSEIIQRQLEREKIRQKYERIQDSYRISLEEAELRLEDIRRAKIEFEQKLLKPLRDNRLEIHEPEKVLQYIKDKSKINQLEKHSLKNQAMRTHERKLQQQLQQRKDLGKAEYEEIFQEFSEPQIEINLDEIRVNSLKAHHALSSNKEKLQRATSELSNLSKEIKKKEQTLARIEEDIHHAEEEHLKMQTLNQHLQHQTADYEAPDTTEYMLIKEKHRKLQQRILTWERKVAVAEMALKTYSKSWTKQRTTFTPVNSAETRARSGGHKFSVKLPDIEEHKDKASYQYQ